MIASRNVREVQFVGMSHNAVCCCGFLLCLGGAKKIPELTLLPGCRHNLIEAGAARALRAHTDHPSVVLELDIHTSS